MENNRENNREDPRIAPGRAAYNMQHAKEVRTQKELTEARFWKNIKIASWIIFLSSLTTYILLPIISGRHVISAICFMIIAILACPVFPVIAQKKTKGKSIMLADGIVIFCFAVNALLLIAYDGV